MKIGEIKKQSLLLIFPEIEAYFDSESDESVNEGISALKCDPSLRAYLEASVPAINRALCEIENAGATRVKKAAVTLGRTDEVLDLKKELPDLLKLIAIYQNGRALQYSERDVGVAISGADRGTIEVYYRALAQRVRYSSEDASELELDYGVCSIIPYFVASELCAQESIEKSRDLREKFFQGLSTYAAGAVVQAEVETVYSW